MGSIFGFPRVKEFGGVGNISRRKFRRMASLVFRKVRTVLVLDSANGRDGDTSFLEDLGPRKSVMEKREYKRGLES